jgi:hypothetical protein
MATANAAAEPRELAARLTVQSPFASGLNLQSIRGIRANLRVILRNDRPIFDLETFFAFALPAAPQPWITSHRRKFSPHSSARIGG